MNGNRLHRQGGSGSQKRNHEGEQASKAKSCRKTSLGDKAATGAKNESFKKNSLGDKAAAAAKSESIKVGAAAARSETIRGDKLRDQGGSGSQKRNHKRRQA